MPSPMPTELMHREAVAHPKWANHESGQYHPGRGYFHPWADLWIMEDGTWEGHNHYHDEVRRGGPAELREFLDDPSRGYTACDLP